MTCSICGLFVPGCPAFGTWCKCGGYYTACATCKARPMHRDEAKGRHEQKECK